MTSYEARPLPLAGGGRSVVGLSGVHASIIHRKLLELGSSSFYFPQLSDLSELEGHLTREAGFNFGIWRDGLLSGFLLGGVTLRGALHHLWCESEHYSADSQLLVRRYLAALAQEGGVRRTNLVYQTGSRVSSEWKSLRHVLPPGEGLVFADLASPLKLPRRKLPPGYEIRCLEESDNIFGFWKDDDDHVSESVLGWETNLLPRMLASCASVVATFEGRLVGGLCAIVSWRSASINHLKVDVAHRHSGIWQHLLHECFERLRLQGVVRAHGTVEHPAAFVKKTSFRFTPEIWSFVQGDLDENGSPL